MVGLTAGWAAGVSLECLVGYHVASKPVFMLSHDQHVLSCLVDAARLTLCRMFVVALEIVEERKSSKVQVRLVFDPPEDIDIRAKITTHQTAILISIWPGNVSAPKIPSTPPSSLHQGVRQLPKPVAVYPALKSAQLVGSQAPDSTPSASRRPSRRTVRQNDLHKTASQSAS